MFANVCLQWDCFLRRTYTSPMNGTPGSECPGTLHPHRFLDTKLCTSQLVRRHIYRHRSMLESYLHMIVPDCTPYNWVLLWKQDLLRWRYYFRKQSKSSPKVSSLLWACTRQLLQLKILLCDQSPVDGPILQSILSVIYKIGLSGLLNQKNTYPERVGW